MGIATQQFIELTERVHGNQLVTKRKVWVPPFSVLMIAENRSGRDTHSEVWLGMGGNPLCVEVEQTPDQVRKIIAMAMSMPEDN